MPTFIETYNHQNRVGVVIEFRCKDAYTFRTEEFRRFAFGLAMHIVAKNDSDLPLIQQHHYKDSELRISDKFGAICEELGVAISVPRYECYVCEPWYRISASGPVMDNSETTNDAKKVRHLRELTGAGLLECKKALAASNGDLLFAMETLKKRNDGPPESEVGIELQLPALKRKCMFAQVPTFQSSYFCISGC